MADASSGETVSFAVPSGCSRIILSTTLAIETSLTIKGPGASSLAVSGKKAQTVIYVRQRYRKVPVDVTISGLTIEDGKGEDGGGVVSSGAGSHSDLYNVVVSNNEGGGILSNNGTMIVANSLVTSNANPSTSGGGITSDGNITVIDSTVSGNTAANGAGIDIDGSAGPASILDSTVSDNSAIEDGGGGVGGGILDNSGNVDLSDSTVSGNSATLAGGGIWNTGTINVNNSTVSGNGSNAGGGIFNYGPSQYVDGLATLTATIVANNTSGSDCSGPITDDSYNLDDDGSCHFSGSSLSDTQAGLDSAGLQSNGGPTQTVALEPDSPAIGYVTPTSDCPATDQRGAPRPNPCSIGAFEPGLISTTMALNSSSNPVRRKQPVVYTAVLTPVPQGGTVEFYDSGYPIGGCFSQYVSSSGKAKCEIVYRGPGTHSITAMYSGDSSYSSSTAGPLAETVDN